MNRISLSIVAVLALAAACGTGGEAQAPVDDVRGVEEINSPAALTALTGKPTFNSTTGAMTIPLAATDKLVIVSRQAVSNAILVNGSVVYDAAGVMAVATGSTGLVKTLQITAAVDGTTVVLDFINGFFAPGVSGSFTSTAPIAQGITVDFAAYSGCAFKIRATGSADTVYMGQDKTSAANKLVSFNNGNFGDIWIKTSGSPVAAPTYGVSLGDGNDVFNAAPPASALGGMLTAFAQPVVVHGGLGDDTLTGGINSDTIYGDEGNNTVDESGYTTPITVTASASRTLTFASAKTITGSSGSFITDGFTSSSSLIVTGTTANGSTATPKTYTIASVTATVITVNEAMVTETAYTANATIAQPSTVHAKDTVFGLASSGVTTVTYAARTLSRASNTGVVVKIGHDAVQPTPGWLAGTEDNLDETVAVVIGTDFKDTMSCSDTTDAPCTLVGGKSDDTLKAGKSAVNTHKLYGGDGADTLLVTDNTDKALLMGGNWTDIQRGAVAVTASGSRTLTFNAAKTITASSGDFAADGFVVGASLVVTGTTANGTTAVPKTFTITNVATLVLTVAEAVTTENAYLTLATVTQPAVAAPKNLWVDSVDFSNVTASDATIDLNFAYPSVAKAYTGGTPYSGSTAKQHINIGKDITRATCPQQSGLQICTFNANNLGNTVIAGKGADVLTGGTGDDYFDLGAVDAAKFSPTFKQINGGASGADSVDFSGRAADTAIDLSCSSSTCKTSGTFRVDPGATVTATADFVFDFTASSKTIAFSGKSATPPDYSGFAVGQTITVAGTASNDGTYTVATVTPTTMTVAEALVDEAAVNATATISRPAGDPGIVVTAAGGRTLTFNSAKTITASTGSWITDGFKVGQTITVAGTTGNNGTFTIASLTATALTVNEAVVTEAAYSATATVTRAPAKVLEGVSLQHILNATCPASSNHSLYCYMTGSTSSNILDFDGCKGTVSCGGGSDIILNADASVDTSCGI